MITTSGRNGDASDTASYHKWLPVGSLKYAASEAWNLYISAGRGFETPTINELSYRSGTEGGLNTDLKPSTSRTIEIGSKTRLGNGMFSAALFKTDTDNEIVVDQTKDSRSSYKNAGKTRRRGMELALDQQFGDSWKLKAARPRLTPPTAATSAPTATATATAFPASPAIWATPASAISRSWAGTRAAISAI